MHGHTCLQGSMDETVRQKRWDRTTSRNKYIQDAGHRVVVQWECEYNVLKKTNPEIKNYSVLPAFSKAHPNKLSVDKILESVKKDKLFGVVEVDIEVSGLLLNSLYY